MVSNSLWPHGLQHTRLPCPLPTPGACSNSRPLSWWCHPTISSSVIRFSSCPQSFPASGSFPLSWLFESDGQRIGTSVSAPVLPMSIQDWFPLGLTGLISLLSIMISHKILEAQGLLWCLIRLTFILAAPPNPHIRGSPHESHRPRGHLHTKDREGVSSHLPGFLSKASAYVPSFPLASVGSQAHDLAAERVGNECLVFLGSMMKSDHHQQEGAEEGLLGKQLRVLGTQTKDAVEHRCRISGGCTHTSLRKLSDGCTHVCSSCGLTYLSRETLGAEATPTSACPSGRCSVDGRVTEKDRWQVNVLRGFRRRHTDESCHGS